MMHHCVVSADGRLGVDELLSGCVSRGLRVLRVSIGKEELEDMRMDTENECLCEERSHSIFVIKWSLDDKKI